MVFGCIIYFLFFILCFIVFMRVSVFYVCVCIFVPCVLLYHCTDVRLSHDLYKDYLLAYVFVLLVMSFQYVFLHWP